MTRRKQSRQHSGVGSLTWDKSKGRWRIRGYVQLPEIDAKTGKPKVSRPVTEVPDEYQSAEGARHYLKLLAREAELKPKAHIARDVKSLCTSFLERAKALYERGDKLASHWGFDRATATQWAAMQGRIRLDDYNGDDFREFRDALDRLTAQPAATNKRRVRTREGVNKKLKAARRIVTWGVSVKLCDPAMLEVLRAVEGVRKGRGTAPDGKGRKACTLAQFNTALPYMITPFADVARLQRWGGGARPTEILSLRKREFRFLEGLWIANKGEEHKTAGKGFTREIIFSPAANDLIERLLDECTKADDYLFSYRRIARKRLMRKALDTLGPHPTEGSYRKAVLDACEVARDGGKDCPDWTPYQLCHLRLSEIKAALGPEHASATRNHSTTAMTAEYTKTTDAERKRRLAMEAARVGVED